MKSFFLNLILLTPFMAQASFLDHKAEGWHWYEEFLQEPDKPIKERQEPSLPEQDPVKILQSFKEKVERFKAIAIIDPTYENVKAYMVLQKQLMDRSTRFAQRWMEVVYTTPKLDYTLTHPTSQVARHIYLDQQKMDMDQYIRALAKTYGLFFFYASGCSYCKEFAPIVKGFAEKYGWEVLAISLDGAILPEFPHSKVDNGAAAALGIEAVPILLAVEPQTGKVIPLSNGLSTHDQIEDRIRILVMERNKL
jgi:conjugal transfer pilus assembly protein TraF